MMAARFPAVFSKKGLVRQRAMELLKEQLGGCEFRGSTAVVEKEVDFLHFPGAREFGEVFKCNSGIGEIKETALECVKNFFETEELEKEEFWLVVKRSGEHDFTSMEVARESGKFIEEEGGFGVDKRGQHFRVEVRGEEVLVFAARRGPGGLPAGLFGDAVFAWEDNFRSQMALLRLAAAGYRPLVVAPLHSEREPLLPEGVGQELWYETVELREALTQALRGMAGPLRKAFAYRMAGMVAGDRGVATVASGEVLGAAISDDPTMLRMVEEFAGVSPVRPVGFMDMERVREDAQHFGAGVRERPKDWKRFSGQELEQEWLSLGLQEILEKSFKGL